MLVSGYIKCSHMHIWRLIKKGLLGAHKSANYPHVSDANKLERKKWVLSHIIPATTKSRNYSIKVMFMGVSSRPLYDNEGHMIHDGKFGVFPFVVKEKKQVQTSRHMENKTHYQHQQGCNN